MENSKIHESGTQLHPVTVMINRQPVNFPDHKANGLEIKKTAIQQGVNIKEDFVLYEIKGGNLKIVKDDETVTLHPNQEFKCVAPDDNSWI